MNWIRLVHLLRNARHQLYRTTGRQNHMIEKCAKFCPIQFPKLIFFEIVLAIFEKT